MKRILLSLSALAVLICLQGCSEEPKATSQDKANIDRLAKEGIGARPLDGGGAPPKTAEDAQPAPP